MLDSGVILKSLYYKVVVIQRLGVEQTTHSLTVSTGLKLPFMGVQEEHYFSWTKNVKMDFLVADGLPYGVITGELSKFFSNLLIGSRRLSIIER